MENRAAPENKRYTLTNEILDKVIELKKAAVNEMERFEQYQRKKLNLPDTYWRNPKMAAAMFVDLMLGDYEFPAKDAFNAYLDTLTDDNLLDLLLLYYMAETVDATF